jgi:hypothetical protein
MKTYRGVDVQINVISFVPPILFAPGEYSQWPLNRRLEPRAGLDGTEY